VEQVKGSNGTRWYIKSPNTVRVAREHFQCPDLTGGEIEDAGGEISASAGHWDSRVYLVRTCMLEPAPVLPCCEASQNCITRFSHNSINCAPMMITVPMCTASGWHGISRVSNVEVCV
jgi:Leishmanolysin